MKRIKKGFTLIELLASIGVIAVIILMATISYTQIRKNILNSQYNNLKILIEQTGVKYSSKTGYRNFFVQDLIDDGLLETDDTTNIYDPRDKSILNCHIVTVSEDDNGNLTGHLHNEDHREDGKCKTSDIDNYKGNLTLTAVIKGTNITYPGTGEVSNPNSIFPYITTDKWTNMQLTLTAVLDNKVTNEERNGGRFVWNKDANVVTEYPNNTMHTNNTGVFNDKYFVDFYTAAGDEYEANMNIKFDLESPVIYQEENNKPRLASGSSNSKWSRSKTVIMYATDKDGVGLQRVYVGRNACTSMKTNASLGQPAVPGMIQTVTVYDSVGATAENYHICAIDKLGNLVDGGTIAIAKIDNTPPDVEETFYAYNADYGMDAAKYYPTQPLDSFSNRDIDIANYHTGGWTATGHFYAFKITDTSSAYNQMRITVNYTPSEGEYKDALPYSEKRNRTLDDNNCFYDAFTGKGKRKMRYEICDGLNNCRIINITNDNVDKTAPATPTMNFIINATNGQVYPDNTWTNQTIIAARKTNAAAPTTTDKGSGVDRYQISQDNDTWVDYHYDGTNSLYAMSITGIHYRYFRAIDKVGNISGVKTLTAKIDKEKPTLNLQTYRYDNSGNASNKDKCTLCGDVITSYQSINHDNYSPTNPYIIGQSGKWYRYGAVFANSASDSGGSNVKSIKWSWAGYNSPTDPIIGQSDPNNIYNSTDSRTHTSNLGTTDYGWTITGQGYRRAQFIVTDNAGNTTTVNVVLLIDNSVPNIPTAVIRYGSSTGTVRPQNTSTYTNQSLWFGNLSATDTFSGVASYEYSSGSDCSATARPFNSLTWSHLYEDNTYTASFCIRAVDNVGLKSEWSKGWNIYIDKIPPSVPEMNFVTSGWNTYSSGWINADLYAARKKGTAADNAPYSTDNLSGIDMYQISKDGGSWTDYSYNSSADMYHMSTTGTNVRYFRAKDKAGNYSDAKRVYGYIDKEKPSVPTAEIRYGSSSGTLRPQNTSTYTNQSLWFGNFSATDQGSGVVNYEYSSGADCSATARPFNSLTWSHLYEDNTYTASFCIRAIDGVGLKSDWSKGWTIYIDKVPPYCTSSGDSTSWQKADRTIYYGCGDALSGCSSSAGGSKTINYTAKTDTIGSYGITDNAGNYTPCDSRTANVYVDKTAPKFVVKNDGTDITSNSTATVNNGKQLTLKCTEPSDQSGTSSRTLKVDEKQVTSGYDSSTYTFTLTGGTSPLSSGTSHTVSLTCTDKVNNSDTKTYTITVPSSGGGSCPGYRSTCVPKDNYLMAAQTAAVCSTCPYGYTYASNIGQNKVFGCKVTESTVSSATANFSTYFLNGISCPYNGTTYSLTKPKVAYTDTTNSYNYKYYSYNCTSGATGTCNGTTYATKCNSTSSDTVFYRYDGKTKYTCTLRTGAEFLSDSTAPFDIAVCCKY